MEASFSNKSYRSRKEELVDEVLKLYDAARSRNQTSIADTSNQRQQTSEIEGISSDVLPYLADDDEEGVYESYRDEAEENLKEEFHGVLDDIATKSKEVLAQGIGEKETEEVGKLLTGGLFDVLKKAIKTYPSKDTEGNCVSAPSGMLRDTIASLFHLIGMSSSDDGHDNLDEEKMNNLLKDLNNSPRLS